MLTTSRTIAEIQLIINTKLKNVQIGTFKMKSNHMNSRGVKKAKIAKNAMDGLNTNFIQIHIKKIMEGTTKKIFQKTYYKKNCRVNLQTKGLRKELLSKLWMKRPNRFIRLQLVRLELHFLSRRDNLRKLLKEQRPKLTKYRANYQIMIVIRTNA
jgi:hypothetical protein